MDILWIRKRRVTFIIFVIQYLIEALQMSIHYVTAWIYIKEIAYDSPHLNIYYGLITGATYLSTMLFSNLISYIADETRSIKYCILFANFIAMIGNILYIMPGSVWYPIIGRFFNGYVMLTRSIIVGEICRVYDEDDSLLRKLQILRGVYGVTRAAAPAIALIFINTKVSIGPIFLRYSNISAVYVFILTLLTQILIMCFASDLSKEFDLKEQRMKKHYTESEISNETKTIYYDRSYSVVNFLSRSLKIFDVHLFFLTNYMRSVVGVAIVLTIPAIVTNDLEYSEATINYIMLVQFVLTLLVIIPLYIAKVNHVDGGILSMLGMILSMLMLLVVSNDLSFAANFTMLVISYTMVEVNIINMNVYVSIGLAQLVASQYQSFMDSIRMQIGCVGFVTGSLLAVVALGHSYSVFIPLMSIYIFLIIITLFRRSAFLNPVIQVT